MIRTVNTDDIVKNIKEMCIEANHFLSEDMEEVFQKAVTSEKSPLGCQILGQLKENLKIAGEDMKFVPAKGKIDKKTNTLVVTSTTVKHPVAVRYSFSNDAVGNLFCSNGLPVLPFRTDNEVIEIF